MARRRTWPWFALALSLCLSNSALRAEEFDWRTVGGNWVTPVKFQDGGTCWAYTGVAALESRLMLTRGDSTWVPDLAEHQIVDRINIDLTPEQRYNEIITYDSGGWTELTYEYAASPGVLSEWEWPSRGSTPLPGWTSRTCKADSYYEVAASVEQIKADLKRYGPLAVSVCSNDLGTSPTLLPEKNSTTTDHVALIVGFRDDPALLEGGYWILKNSWGVFNGTQGYYFARYNVPQCSTVLTGRAYFDGATAQTSWNGGSGTWADGAAGWTAGVNGGLWRNGEQAAAFTAGSGTIAVGPSTSAHAVAIGAGAAYTFVGGSLIVTAGGLTVDENAAFSTRLRVGYDHDWTVAAGKTLVAQDVDLHINKLTIVANGNVQINGAVTDVTTNATFNGLLSGTVGSLTKSGAGTLTLGSGPADATANTFAGTTTVNAGTVVLNKQAGVAALGGDLVLAGGVVRLAASEQLVDARSVSLSGGVLDLAGHHETVGSLTTTGGGSIAMGGGQLTADTFRHTNGTLTLNGRLAVTGTAHIGRPQYASYTYTAVPLESIDLVAGAPGVTTLILNGDDKAAAVNLGTNSFGFFNASYTGANSLYASTNALITFGADDPAYNNSNLSASPVLAAIAPLWDDWAPSGLPAVLYKIEDLDGDQVADRLIVEWNQNKYSGSVSTNYITHQAILALNTGDAPGSITFNYVDLDSGDTHSNGATATVGLKAEGATNPTRLLISYNATNPLVGSGKAIQFMPVASGNSDTLNFEDGVLTAATLVNDGIVNQTGGEVAVGTVYGLGCLTVGGGVSEALFQADAIRQDSLTIAANGRVEITAGGGFGAGAIDLLTTPAVQADFTYSTSGGSPAAAAAAVPEPSAWLLAALAALSGLVARRRGR